MSDNGSHDFKRIFVGLAKKLLKSCYRDKETPMSDDKYYFEKLTPIDNVDLGVYKEALDFVFANEDVKNVAISGAYSAGKSSVLESYKANYSNHKFLHISLARFHTQDQTEHNPGEVKDSILEGKILNQLIHQIPADKIPQTNFRIKKGVSKKKLCASTLSLSVFIASIAHLLLFSTISVFVATLPDNIIKTVMSLLVSPYAAIGSSLVCSSCVVYFVYLLIRAQRHKSVFRKINVQGNEIEIFEDQEDSYFDKYLNEVLYLFENAGADVIVFEDMDRFNASRIFERLREVNTLVNVQRIKEGSHSPLRFFYLLRDDIFVTKDRTKFFDYIIPVVPVVDSSNSFDQFLKHLEKGNLISEFDQGFLQRLSLYIDDMRILKNIYNEFVIYIHRLNTTELNWNKMMAMITYKNLFPRDFSDLQLSKGYINELFQQKELLIGKTKEDLEDQRNQLLKRIEISNNEIMSSQQELDDVYEAKKSRLPKNYYGSYTVESSKIALEYDKELRVRKQALEDSLPERQSYLERELTAINHKISLVSASKLSEVITRENDDSVFMIEHTNQIGEINDFCEIKKSEYFPLLKFLIREGFIDETFADYMSYFYDNSLSINDKIFLRRITDRRGALWTYSLKEPSKVLRSPALRTVDFEQEETLNFDLLECMLNEDAESKSSDYLKALVAYLSKQRNYDFISRFFQTGKAQERFIEKFNILWPTFFCDIQKGGHFTNVQLKEYAIGTLCFSSNDAIIKVNANGHLTDYISNCADFLDIEKPNIGKLVAGLELLHVSFESIDFEKSHKALFAEVYRRNIYRLSFDNISLMLQSMHSVKNEVDIAHRNLTLVMEQKNSPLLERVLQEIGAYVEIILDNCDGLISDNEDVAISLLNNDRVVFELKTTYVEYLSTKIETIERIEDLNLWPELLKQEKVVPSVKNFIDYYLEFELDDALIVIANLLPFDVDFTHIAGVLEEENAKKLFDEIVACNQLKTEIYTKILVDLGYVFDTFDKEKIDNDKFEVLIAEEILQMDEQALEFVRRFYAQHLFTFIKKNVAEYLNIQNETLFSLNEALQIITWDIDDEQKISLLKLTDEEIPVIGKQYTDAVNAHIISFNLFEPDKLVFYQNYAKFEPKSKEAIFNVAQRNVQAIIDNQLILDDELLSRLLLSEEVSRLQKIKLLVATISQLNEETCMSHFDELDLSELKGIFAKGGGRRNYIKNEETTEVLEGLKRNGWIYEYRDDDRNNEKYVVIKNRPRTADSDYVD